MTVFFSDLHVEHNAFLKLLCNSNFFSCLQYIVLSLVNDGFILILLAVLLIGK